MADADITKCTYFTSTCYANLDIKYEYIGIKLKLDMCQRNTFLVINPRRGES